MSLSGAFGFSGDDEPATAMRTLVIALTSIAPGLICGKGAAPIMHRLRSRYFTS